MVEIKLLLNGIAAKDHGRIESRRPSARLAPCEVFLLHPVVLQWNVPHVPFGYVVFSRFVNGVTHL